MSDRRLAVAALVVVAAAVAAHATVLDGGFVYDDHRFIEHNVAIRSLSVADFLTDPSTASVSEGIQHDVYRPLRTLLFALEFQLFASVAPDGTVEFHLPWWHAISLLLHALNAVLVLRLLLPLLRGAWAPATLGAALFAVHPVTSESVAWLSSQGDLLALTLMLAALLVLERRGTGRTVLGAGLFALACLAKESALVLPALLWLRDLALPRSAEGDRTPWPRTTWTRTALLAVVAGLYFALRLHLLAGLAQVEHVDGSPWATARTMLGGLIWYAGALLWPAGFSFDVRIDVPLRWTDPAVVVGLGLLLTTLATGVWALRARRWVLAFATLGFLVTLGPVSNVLVPLKAFVADRFLYPGLVCAVGGAAAALGALRGTSRYAAVTVLLGLVGLLAVLAGQRTAAWADDYSLWDAVRADRPSNPNAYQGIAFEYARQRKVGLAEKAYASYLEANPFDGKSLATMADLFGELAESLVTADPQVRRESNITLRHRQARVAQIELYRRALRIWDAPGGLVVGRGSPAMRARMLTRWMDAGVDLGDLRTAKYANDRAIDLEARGFGHDDAAAVMARATWLQRRARVLFALRAVQTVMERGLPPAEHARNLADRAAVLQDVGLDPNLADRSLLPALEGLVTALIDEALARPGIVPDPGLFLHQAALLVANGRPEHARAALRRAIQIHPDVPALADELAAVTALLRQRGGG